MAGIISSRPMPWRPEFERARPELVALAGVLLLYAVWPLQNWIPLGPEKVKLLFFPAADGVVVYAAWRASRRCEGFPTLRRFWLFLAGAWAAELVADLIFAVYVVGFSSNAYPSLADPFYLAFYPLLLVALVQIPTGVRSHQQRVRMLLDSATIVVGGGAAVWYFVLGPTVTQGGQPFLATVVSVAYPVGDLVLLAALGVVTLRRSPTALQAPLALIAVGLLASIFADMLYGAGTLNGTYQPGDPVDTLYLLITIPFALAAVLQRPMRAGEPAGRVTGSAELSHPARMPVLSMTLGFGIVIATQRHEQFFPALSLLFFALVLAGLVAVRQYIAQQELQRTAVALRESERRYRAIFDNAAVGITYTDLKGPTILDANSTFARMVGSTPEQLRGQDYTQIAQPQYRGADRALAQAIQDGEVGRLQQELGYLAADGSKRWAMLSVSVLNDEHGTPSRVVGIFEDITMRKHAEQIKDEFVSIVSHELRTPLTSIRGSLGLLQGGVMGELPDEALHMLTIAVANTDRLVRLVNDILEFERLDSGSTQLQTIAVPARQLITTSIQVIEGIANQANVTTETTIDDITVNADPEKIIQTLTNLLGNAIKFSSPGATVTITATRQQNHATFSVHDTGRGIPKDQLQTIFERFSQVDASDAREKGGTGLGLAIAQEIIEHHHGRIWATSTPQQGTTFSFTLPLATPTSDKERDESPPPVVSR